MIKILIISWKIFCFSFLFHMIFIFFTKQIELLLGQTKQNQESWIKEITKKTKAGRRLVALTSDHMV